MTYAYFPAYSEGTTEKQQKIHRDKKTTKRRAARRRRRQKKKTGGRPKGNIMKNDTFNQIINANLASIDPGFGQFALAKASSDLMKKVLNK